MKMKELARNRCRSEWCGLGHYYPGLQRDLICPASQKLYWLMHMQWKSRLMQPYANSMGISSRGSRGSSSSSSSSMGSSNGVAVGAATGAAETEQGQQQQGQQQGQQQWSRGRDSSSSMAQSSTVATTAAVALSSEDCRKKRHVQIRSQKSVHIF